MQSFQGTPQERLNSVQKPWGRIYQGKSPSLPYRSTHHHPWRVPQRSGQCKGRHQIALRHPGPWEGTAAPDCPLCSWFSVVNKPKQVFVIKVKKLVWECMNNSAGFVWLFSVSILRNLWYVYICKYMVVFFFDKYTMLCTIFQSAQK